MEQTNSIDIEKALTSDLEGNYKHVLIAQFTEYSIEIKEQLNRGVIPEEYQKLNLLLQAIDAAITLVEPVWQKLQKVK